MTATGLAIVAGLAGGCLTATLAKAIYDDHRTPRKRCVPCDQQTTSHPAGPVHRYTRRRVDGIPTCKRH